MYKQFTYIILALLLTLNTGLSLFAQNQTVTGYVLTEGSKEAIPYANIAIKGTSQGVASEWNGFFKISASVGQTINFSSIGFTAQDVLIDKNTKEELIIYLKPLSLSLDEIKVVPDKDFATEVLKEFKAHKKENHKEILSFRNYKDIANTTIYIALDSTSRTGQYFQNIDSSTITIENDQLNYTPIYVSQASNNVVDNVSTLVHSHKEGIIPKLEQTIESLMSQYLLVDLDFYNDKIYIFDKSFLSPLSNNASLFYNIYFSDSTVLDSQVIYNFSFTPKNKYAPLFTGEFSLNKHNYSLRQVNVYFREQANINFVSGFSSTLAYKEQDNGKQFLSYQDIKINLSFADNKSDKKGINASQRVEKVSGGNWLLNKTTVLSTSKKLERIEAKLWNTQDEFKAKTLDAEDYKRIERIQKKPLIKTLDAAGGVLLTGYANLGYIDLGSVFDMYSTNAIEQHRFTLPLRTSEALFEHFTVGAFVGYGSRSKEIKYGGNWAWQPFKNDNYIIRMQYLDDYLLITDNAFSQFIKKNTNSQGSGNVITAITTRERNPYLKEEKKVEMTLEYNSNKSVNFELIPYYTWNYATPQVRFIRDASDYTSYDNAGILLNMRIAPNQHYDKLYFDRIYYYTQSPIINISANFGSIALPDAPNDLMYYTHLHGALQGGLNFGNMLIHYMINAGYLWGDAPYDMLDMPAGTQSLGMGKYRYNLLHQAAFAHNAYSNIYLDVNGGGFIFNRIPLLRELKWRETFSANCHYGTRNDAYSGIFDLPNSFANTLTDPYLEMGIGITNIFKFLRVEYVRQVGNYYKTENVASKQGIRLKAELRF